MYDVIVIGCGPAGMTAAIYLLRAGKKVLILEKEGIGGQIASSPLVENYPGYKSISGAELANNLYEQVIELGGEIELESVIKIEDGSIKKIVTEDNIYEAKAIIIATGSKHRKLNLENEDDFIGNGISFCVACDGAFYKGKTVAVIGGGNSAIINAISLSDICNKVIVIQNLSKLTAEEALINKLLEKKNIEVIYNSKVIKYLGDNELTGILINENGDNRELIVDGIFISIGLIPETGIVKNIVTLNESNYIKADNNCFTNVDGIYVAGDCRDKNVRQLTTATSDGTIAAINVINYLNN